MPISNDDDTQELSKQCVLAVHEHRIEELILILSRRGITMSETEIRTRADAWADVWRIFDSSKSNCFLCKAPRGDLNTLCNCFNDVRVKQYHDPYDFAHVQSLHPDALIETYQCKKCGDLAHIRARHVISKHRKQGHYKTPRLCMPCYDATVVTERGGQVSTMHDASVSGWQRIVTGITVREEGK